MSGRQAGGPRWVEVDPARLLRWLATFAERHGTPVQTVEEYAVRLAAPDGSTAVLHPPPGAPVPADLDDLVAGAAVVRRVGLLLARKGAVAVGVALGEELEVSKVDSHYVQGRTAAGGWSQQRFARRRDNQAKAAAGDAADLVLRLLVPVAVELAAVVTGGDRRAVDAVLADPRLAPVAALRSPRLLDVPEPRLVVLREAARRARAVPILIDDRSAGTGP
ncbi:acVLRF1 family peptidyl-tRNA hydrolase [Luedemannella helvata]|uniref:AcVLRF1 family peptidyl-tRNA hydrolase n=1 Tax=Luedemannella helvata TaxID=349315 RepID=A0ABP4WTU4_9ACTN